MERSETGTALRTSPKERLQSLDTLRGFDMLMLMAGCGIIASLAEATGWGWLEALAVQTEHVEWEGFRFYDLIFPLFMFVSGVAIPYAIHSKIEKGVARSRLLRKIFIRLVALVALGLLYNGATQRGFTNLRYASVLAQIGFGYFFAALIFLYSRNIRISVLWLIVILAGVTILQMFVPVPGYGAGTFEPASTINAWLDQRLIPGRLYNEVFDPEGFLCIVSAIAVTLMGAFAGYVIRSTPLSPSRKSLYILIGGGVLVIIALLLSPVYPIIKKMWTVPYVLLAGGISALLLGTFYYVIDVRGSKSWTLFFRVYGMNSITIYVGARIISFYSISQFFLNWISVHFSEEWGAVFISLGVLALQEGLLYFMYRRRIFLRV
jgi:predicted acyltransferase